METQGKGKLRTGSQALASLKNNRAQRILEKELKQIENHRRHELRNIAYEKLDATRDYWKLADDRRNAEYLSEFTTRNEKNDRRRLQSVKEYTEYSINKRNEKKEHKYIMEKYDFKAHENDKIRVHLHEIDRPVSIIKENGIVQSLPPIPSKPRLARSNSVVGELIKAKSSSEENVPSVNFGQYLQRDSKVKPNYLNLPEIIGQRLRKRDLKSMTLSAIPDIDELDRPEMPSKKKFLLERRVASVTPIAVEPRRHTVL